MMDRSARNRTERITIRFRVNELHAIEQVARTSHRGSCSRFVRWAAVRVARRTLETQTKANSAGEDA